MKPKQLYSRDDKDVLANIASARSMTNYMRKPHRDERPLETFRRVRETELGRKLTPAEAVELHKEFQDVCSHKLHPLTEKMIGSRRTVLMSCEHCGFVLRKIS